MFLLKVVMIFSHWLLLTDKEVKKRISYITILIRFFIEVEFISSTKVFLFVKLNLGFSLQLLLLVNVVIFFRRWLLIVCCHFTYLVTLIFFQYPLLSSFIVVRYRKTTAIVEFKCITSHIDILCSYICYVI